MFKQYTHVESLCQQTAQSMRMERTHANALTLHRGTALAKLHGHEHRLPSMTSNRVGSIEGKLAGFEQLFHMFLLLDLVLSPCFMAPHGRKSSTVKPCETQPPSARSSRSSPLQSGPADLARELGMFLEVLLTAGHAHVLGEAGGCSPSQRGEQLSKGVE